MINSSHTTTREMTHVLLALLPGLFALSLIFGSGVWVHILIMVPTALAAEAVVLLMRKRNPRTCLSDLSATVTATLLAAALPPLLPWWMAVLGTLFAIILAKQLYGGLGQNPFNPAMVGYVILLISFPLEMTSWLPPLGLDGNLLSLRETAAIIFGIGPQPALDTLTGATPLDAIKTTLGQGLTIQEALQTIPAGILAGPGWEWVNLAFLAGGIILLLNRTISWHIPVSMLLSLHLMAFFFNTVDPDNFSTPLYHLLSGGTMLGAFFIATDPVTSSTTPMGRIWYGAGIGVLVYVIRTWGGYPDAIAFGVLLMNMSAPLIDHFTQPVIYGSRSRKRDS